MLLKHTTNIIFRRKIYYLMNSQCSDSGFEPQFVDDRSLEINSPLSQKCCMYWEFKMETLVLFGFDSEY